MRTALWFRIALRKLPRCVLLRREHCLPMPLQLRCPEAEKVTAYETPARAPRVQLRLPQSRRLRLQTKDVRTRAGASSVFSLENLNRGHLAMPFGECREAIRE